MSTYAHLIFGINDTFSEILTHDNSIEIEIIPVIAKLLDGLGQLAGVVLCVAITIPAFVRRPLIPVLDVWHDD